MAREEVRTYVSGYPYSITDNQNTRVLVYNQELETLRNGRGISEILPNDTYWVKKLELDMYVSGLKK